MKTLSELVRLYVLYGYILLVHITLCVKTAPLYQRHLFVFQQTWNSKLSKVDYISLQADAGDAEAFPQEGWSCAQAEPRTGFIGYI